MVEYRWMHTYMNSYEKGNPDIFHDITSNYLNMINKNMVYILASFLKSHITFSKLKHEQYFQRSCFVLSSQGRIQDFHWGGGGCKRLCASTHIMSTEPNSLSAGVQGPLKGPGSSGGCFNALSCNLSLIFKHSDKKKN